MGQSERSEIGRPLGRAAQRDTRLRGHSRAFGALGVRLVNRTTRSVELTLEGEQLLPVAAEAVQSFTAVRARLAAGEARRRDLVAEAKTIHFR